MNINIAFSFYLPGAGYDLPQSLPPRPGAVDGAIPGFLYRNIDSIGGLALVACLDSSTGRDDNRPARHPSYIHYRNGAALLREFLSRCAALSEPCDHGGGGGRPGHGPLFHCQHETDCGERPPGRTGVYQSFFAGFFSLGNILVYLLVPKLIASCWQSIYLMPGLFSQILFIFSFGVQAQALVRASPSHPFAPLGRILRTRVGWVIGFYHALSWGAMISLATYPPLLAEFWPDTSAARLALGGRWSCSSAVLVAYPVV